MEPVIYVVDDDQEIREQIESVLKDEKFNVQSFGRADQFLEVFDPSVRGCVLLDERMPGLTGTDVIQRISNWINLFPVILVTGYADVNFAVNVMRSGAFDLIEKPFAIDDLIARVRRALAKSETIWTESQEDAQNWLALQKLTPREREILELILEGHSSKMVGAKLKISPRTVDNHRVHIMSKLRAKSLGDLGRAVTKAQALFSSTGAPKQK